MGVSEARCICHKSAEHRRNQGTDQKHPSYHIPDDSATDLQKFRTPFGPVQCALQSVGVFQGFLFHFPIFITFPIIFNSKIYFFKSPGIVGAPFLLRMHKKMI